MRRLATVVAFGLVGTGLPVSPALSHPQRTAAAAAAAAEEEWEPPVPDDVVPVDGVGPATWSHHPTWSADDLTVHGDTDVAWPEAGQATVDLEPGPPGGSPPVIQAAGLPVRVAAATEDLGKVEVRTYEHKAATSAGVAGLLLSVGRADGTAAAADAAVTVDYGDFAAAGGGDWASRLRLVRLPACALTTPDVAGCTLATPLPTLHDPDARTVTAVAPLAGTGGATVLAVAAAPACDNGDYTATSLTAASTWDASTQTGAFTWSLPLRVPPGLGGPTPELALYYSSQTVDGRTGGNNTQGSWAGDGFDLWPGYIERSYRSCADDTGPVDGKDPNNKTRPTGDQCWWKANATLSLNGHGGELVDAGGGRWRSVNDDGTKVELVPGGAAGEHWKVTTVDGMQYFFGRAAASNSAWTTEVYGNHPGEPGYTAGNFAASRRTQVWRWNLDQVVDPSGNTMTFSYEKEQGAYGRELDPAKRTTYDRGGYLTRIDYGTRGDSAAPAAAQVVFHVEDRCKPGATCFDGNGKPIAASFPDTPFDQYCFATPCTTQTSPTFWTQKRLAWVRTQVRNDAGGYDDVESWTLRHEWLDAGAAKGEGIPMFLRGVTHTGLVGDDVAEPEIVFDPGAEPLPNRVDGPSDNRTALNRWRIKRITTESGAQLVVDYKPPQCHRDALPVAHANAQLCFPQLYAPEGETPTTDWFHKYVVGKLTANDNAAGSDPEVTYFDYLDTPAWHFDDTDLVKEDKRTWSQFRGFGRVQVRTGIEGAPQLATEERFLRGMDGDRQPDNGTRDVWVTDSWGNRIEDHEAYAGRTLETTRFDGAGGAWVDGSLTTPTAPVRTAAAGPLEAWRVNTGVTRAYSRTTVEPDGVRWSRTETTYNDDGLPAAVNDLGDETTASDDLCTRTDYARNPDIWMLDRVARTETVGVACTATPTFPADIVASRRTTYDDPAADWSTQKPMRGLPVEVKELDSWSGTTPQWVTTATTGYDANGRTVTSADALGRTTTTAYTPAAGGPVTRQVVTNPKGHKATSELAPAWGLPTTVTDANDVASRIDYDGLGRLTKVWKDGRARSDTPDLAVDYLVRNNAPSAVTTRTLLPSGSATTTKIALYDGWLRERQTQTEAPGGGRSITETHYNSRAEKSWTAAPYYDKSNKEPETTLLTVSRSAIPSVTELGYDGAGRVTSEALHGTDGERWHTTTAYTGDLTTVTPPTGGTRTATLVDARGRTVETRRYHARTGPTGPADYDATRYTYTDAGNPATVTDPAGNVWKHAYDQRGREIRNEDPDKGVSRASYDAAGQTTSTTDARGVTLATTYDELGRKETLRDGSATGPVRARWVYDTLTNGIGRLTRSTRYDSSGDYVREITGYDAGGRVTASNVTIPSTEGALCAAGGTTPCTFATTTTYKANGQVSTVTLPRAGDLTAEQLTQNYDDVGEPTTITASSGTLMRSVHYDKTGRLTQRVLGPLGRQAALDDTIDDTTGRVTDSDVALEQKPSPLDLAYRYDDAGNLLRIHDTPFGQPTDTQCYGYDHLQRLVEAWTPANADCGPAPAVAALGGPAAYWHSYRYEGTAGLTGSRTREVRHADGGDTARTYGYPAQGGIAGSRPHGLTQVDTDNPTGADTVDTYGYDASGNTTTKVQAGASTRLDWDAEGHLQKVTAPGNRVTSFLYDADGERLIRRDPGSGGTGTTLYLPGGQEVNLPVGGTTAVGTRYYSHAGETIGVRTKAAGLTFLATDHHGTAEVAIKGADLSVTRRRTLPFGAPRGPAATGWPGDKGFVGGTEDVAGLVRLGAREYEPSTGRFVSVDPLIDQTDAQQMHGYAYANNAPPTMSDPTGMMTTARDGGGGGGGGSTTACTGTPDRCADQAGKNDTGSSIPIPKKPPSGPRRPAGPNAMFARPLGDPVPNPTDPQDWRPDCHGSPLCEWGQEADDWIKRKAEELWNKEWENDWGTLGAGLTNVFLGAVEIDEGLGAVGASGVLAAPAAATAGPTAGGTAVADIALAAGGLLSIGLGVLTVKQGAEQLNEYQANPKCVSRCTTGDNLERWAVGVLNMDKRLKWAFGWIG